MRPLGRLIFRLLDNIKTEFGVTGWGSIDWLHLVRDRHQWRALVNTVMNFWVP
jgi:hypothetical protein